MRSWLPFLTVLVLLADSRAAATDANWLRYENPHFIAYSNAPEKKVAPLLSDLETFRAAFLQVGNISVPPDAPKVTVLIPASMQEFQKLAQNKLVVGFATGNSKRPLIVMPAQGEKDLTRTTIRHEYGHVLLHYKDFAYPAWFEEGFAELVSSTKIVNKGQSFTIGMPPERARYNGPPLFDWDTLVSDEFMPHTLIDPRRGSSAYSQAWLLAHYAIFGNDLKNARMLQKYFDALGDGEAQVAAFRSAFGKSAAEMWNDDLKAYTKHIPVYTYPYRPGSVQLAFTTSAVSGNEVDSLLRYLELRATIDTNTELPKDILASLPGRWAPFDMNLACENPTDFAVEGTADSGTFTITPAASSAGPAAEPMRFRYNLAEDGLILLEPEGEDTDAMDVLSIRPRSTNLLCMGSGNQADGCAGLMYRCNQ